MAEADAESGVAAALNSRRLGAGDIVILNGVRAGAGDDGRITGKRALLSQSSSGV